MSLKELTTLSKEEFKKFIESIDVVLSDCDGVLWRENEVIPGSPETVDKFKQIGKKFFYITNNNTKSRSEFVDKCKELNYKATEDEVVCTSFLAAVYLKEKNFDQTVYVIGNNGIGKELEEEGIKYCGIGPDPMEGDELEMLQNFEPVPNIGAVVVGFDKYFSYPKLVKAATYLADPDVHFLGTNCDTERPSPNSNKFPGTGCFVKAIESACSREAVMLGKPAPFLIEFIINKYGLNPQRTLMIGDNCATDILLGKRCAFKTLLVLSGVTTKSNVVDMINHPDKNFIDVGIPDYYTDQLDDVLKMLTSS